MKNHIEHLFSHFLDSTKNFYVLDTETTGLGPDAEICEIAILDQDGNPVVDSFIKPTKPIPSQASSVHHIYDQDVINSPTWDKVYGRIKSILENQTVLIYNAAYDTRIIQYCNCLYGLSPFGAKAKCVMLPFAEWNGDWNEAYAYGNYRWVKLSKAASLLNIDTSKVRLHRAVGDCQLTLEIVKTLGRRK